jgi:benzoyl-CoA reductase/2-hydroxyglutaryl-CoA dehydratase subunit BcrC/BadD/HgdB
MSRTIAVADSLVPEEILHAAGLSTVRLSDLVDPSGGDGFFPSTSCTYCRAAERLATRRPRPFDGAVFANGCTSMEKLFEVFARKSGLPLVMLLDTPKIEGEPAVRYYARRLEQFAGALAAACGSAVEGEALAEAIRLNDAFRAGLRRSGQCRSRELAGAALSLASLPDQIRKLPEPGASDGGDAPRLLIAGTHLREDLWRAAIEAEGGCASYFLTEHGDGYSQLTVSPSGDGDLYGALARAYLGSTRASFGRLPAVLTDPAALGATVREHRIQGIVLTQYSFCAKAGYEGAWLNARQDLFKTPVLRLELDRPETVDAQARTRIAAFLEMLRN